MQTRNLLPIKRLPNRIARLTRHIRLEIRTHSPIVDVFVRCGVWVRRVDVVALGFGRGGGWEGHNECEKGEGLSEVNCRLYALCGLRFDGELWDRKGRSVYSCSIESFDPCLLSSFLVPAGSGTPLIN